MTGIWTGCLRRMRSEAESEKLKGSKRERVSAKLPCKKGVASRTVQLRAVPRRG